MDANKHIRVKESWGTTKKYFFMLNKLHEPQKVIVYVFLVRPKYSDKVMPTQPLGFGTFSAVSHSLYH